MGMPLRRRITLTLLRFIPLAVIALLLARPVRVRTFDEDGQRQIVLLMDRSASMALEDTVGANRYQDAIKFARETFLPAVQAAGYKIRPLLFDGSAQPANATDLVNAKPTGEATDLPGAISTGLSTTTLSPLAIVALTDGASNQPGSTRSAVSALLAAKAPFIGVGFGSERGVQTLNLLQVDAPSITPPKSRFRVSARLEATLTKPLPGFDLVLLRDGKFQDRRHVESLAASRFWSDSFELTENDEGVHTYQVQLEPPDMPGLAVINNLAKATVRVTKEEEFRVLYMQGALTWDYKFIGKALRNDPSVKVTGLSRTSAHSVFRQNVEAPGELVDGFPDDVKELAPFRAVILANLNPSQLTTPQQEAIAKFCGEFGGGVLMIGGRGTFDASWQGSRLEQLMPVRFDEDKGVQGLDQPFHIRLTAEALSDPVFEIAKAGQTREAWEKLPPFDDYGRVAEAKPGAIIWAVHSTDVGANGKPRILMASQRYGSGMAAVITIQNFWKWRLAKESEQEQFDRFWQQFMRRLTEEGRQVVRIEVLNQELRPDREIAVTVEKLAETSKTDEDKPKKIHFQVRDSGGTMIADHPMELTPGRAEKATFSPQKADIYTLTAVDEAGLTIASRTLEIRAPNIELLATARDMSNLQQWGMLSGGSAWTVEAARQDPEAFIRGIVNQIEAARRARSQREPLGVSLWSFLLVTLPLCAGWILRKRWIVA